MTKRKPYKYQFGDTVVTSWRKLYKLGKDGIYGHKKGDFFEPCSPQLQFKISMATLPKETNK